MKDKRIEDLIENLSDIDELDLDIDEIWSEADLDESDIDKIKENTYEKIGRSKIRKYNNKRIISLVASLFLVVVIGSGVGMSLVNKIHKYDFSSGTIFKSEANIYVLKESITKKAYNGEITLTSFLINTEENSINVQANAMNVDGYEYKKNQIKINGKKVYTEEYEQIDKTEGVGSNWSSGVYNVDYEYKEGDSFEYSIIFKNKDNKILSIDFPVEVVKAKSVEEYNEYLPKDSKHNVTVSAITNEKDNILYIGLMAIPDKDSMDFEVNSYGNYTVINNRTGIFLTDANGEKVEIEPLVEDESSTKFKVDVTNLKKPYTLEINQVNVNTSDLKMVKVKLPYLEVNKRKWIDMVIDIEDENNTLTKGSSKVLIKSVKRIKDEGEDAYTMNLDYPDNDNSPIKMRGISIDAKLPLGSILNNYISALNKGTYSTIIATCYAEGDIFYNSTLYMGKSNKKYRSVTFKIGGNEYFIEGPWKLTLE